MSSQSIISHSYSPAKSYSILRVDKLLTGVFLFSAVLGYVLSYQKIYLFHVITVLYFLCMVLGFVKVKKGSLKIMQYVFILLSYFILSLIWAPSLVNGLYYIFYFICATTIIFVVVNYAQDINKLNFVFKVLAIFLLLNFFIGLLETTGMFRLPVSPYYGEFSTWPSGFNSNLNNFGFVFLAIFPFLFLYPSRIVKALATLLAAWFLFKLESKGFFLGLLVFYFCYFLVEIKKKSTWCLIIGIGILIFIASLFVVFAFGNINLDNRVFSTFGQIERGIDLIINKDIESKDSTGIRSSMYLYGVQELINSYGLGLGAAGIGTNLANEAEVFGTDKEFLSFHNFFLEIMVDFGVIPFLLLMYGYLQLARQLLKISKYIGNIKIRYYSKASALSLLTMVPASISPSSIIYIFTFWLVIGFALANVNIYKIIYNDS